MRILVIFIDMLRTSELNIFDFSKEETVFDKYLNNLGGTIYKNVFTPCPDTGRSLSTFWSGVPCYLNGCNKRLKYPGAFLEYPSFLEVLESEGYSVNILTNRNRFLFPPGYQDGKYYMDDLDSINKKFHSTNKSFFFIDLPILHEILDVFDYTNKAFSIGMTELTNALKEIESIDVFNEFDFVVHFSDHGHLFRYERAEMNTNRLKAIFMSDSRTKTLVHIKNMNEDSRVTLNENFSTIGGFGALIFKSLGIRNYPNSFSSTIGDEGVSKLLVEDFFTTENKIDQVPNIWNFKEQINKQIINRIISSDDLLNASADEITEIKSITEFSYLKKIFEEYRTYQTYIMMKEDMKLNSTSKSFYKIYNEATLGVKISVFLGHIIKRLLPAKIYMRIRSIVMRMLS